jgi:hypothetical protein
MGGVVLMGELPDISGIPDSGVGDGMGGMGMGGMGGDGGAVTGVIEYVASKPDLPSASTSTYVASLENWTIMHGSAPLQVQEHSVELCLRPEICAGHVALAAETPGWPLQNTLTKS